MDCDHGAAGDDEEGRHLSVSLSFGIMLWQSGEEGRRLDDGTFHLVTLSEVGEEEDLPKRTRGNLSRECAARGPTASRKLSTMVRSISCQSRSHSDGMQRGYFDWQVARPWRRDVWERSGSLGGGRFCTISSHFLLSVRCRMSITGKSLPYSEGGRKEEQESNKGRRKKRKKMFPTL